MQHLLTGFPTALTNPGRSAVPFGALAGFAAPRYSIQNASWHPSFCRNDASPVKICRLTLSFDCATSLPHTAISAEGTFASLSTGFPGCTLGPFPAVKRDAVSRRISHGCARSGLSFIYQL